MNDCPRQTAHGDGLRHFLDLSRGDLGLAAMSMLNDEDEPTGQSLSPEPNRPGEKVADGQ
jgi:hypothetical protein